MDCELQVTQLHDIYLHNYFNLALRSSCPFGLLEEKVLFLLVANVALAAHPGQFDLFLPLTQ